ncbi:MAG: flagellar basal body L-ring protein FlgH, partial [Pseudomonadales bacterium]|nr:flagellar basal body L-ring protein FlgH [Pseudomonadales bacterium]
MMNRTSAVKLTALIIVLALVHGCMIRPPLPPSREEPTYRPAYPSLPALPPPAPGSLVSAEAAWSLFDDSRARRVGDVVTIRLEERTQSSKSAETTIAKGSQIELPNPTLFGNLVQGHDDLLFNSIDSQKGFSGSAESDQSNRLSGTLTAVIAEVLPNGLMLVQGEKWMNLNRGEEYLRVSGLVRPEDVDAYNAVSSLRLADARISYSGTGATA